MFPLNSLSHLPTWYNYIDANFSVSWIIIFIWNSKFSLPKEQQRNFKKMLELEVVNKFRMFLSVPEMHYGIFKVDFITPIKVVNSKFSYACLKLTMASKNLKYSHRCKFSWLLYSNFHWEFQMFNLLKT